MVIHRWLARSHRILLVSLIIFLYGCEQANEGQKTNAPQQSNQPSQTAEPIRAPRTAEAFQKAIEDGKVGTIGGNVSLNGPPPVPEKLPVTINRSACGDEKHAQSLLVSENGGIQNAVLSLLRIPEGLPMDTSASPPQLDQQQCVFIPHVLIVPADMEFDVLNSDPVLHNFHAVGTHNEEINVMQTRTKRRQLPVKFANPDVVRVACDVHSWMNAWIIVAEHPYYTLTDATGRFSLGNVPEGNYRIKVWHEELGEQIQDVTVKANQETVIGFSFDRP